MTLLRKIYEIEGVVQGVGFRPAIYCLAFNAGLGGWVKNCSGKVRMALEGEEDKINEFIISLDFKLPKQARIDSIRNTDATNIDCISKFKILESDIDSSVKVSIPADLAMCRDCEKEITDPLNRRYKYPFTTCVNCGPRYTVVNSMPYDRCRTTLKNFPLCKDCEKEYTDPLNRRFHAESTACPVCGPKLFITDSKGEELKCNNPIDKAVQEIKAGKIIAIRGIGGFLLAVNAYDRSAVENLRERKKRPHKPFAVMAENIKLAKNYCEIDSKEESVLNSTASPIVILKLKENTNIELPIDLLTPDSKTLGVMLPYSPLHKLLFHKTGLKVLVMTSGNRGGEPICIKNKEAFERLNGIADYFLCHNREINLRNDDSLCTVQNNQIQLWRRARGFAPEPIKFNYSFNKTILAMGAELKNCIALAHDKEVVVSPHIGDLETSEAVDGLEQVVKCFPEFLNQQPKTVVVDLHPDMHSTRLGEKIAEEYNIPIIKVQHHHAHAVSCMAENGLDKAFAVVFDGTGLGTDGKIWGAEVMHIDGGNYSRLATFDPVPLPGGDKAVFNPVRQFVARLNAAGIVMSDKMMNRFGITNSEYQIWKMQCDKRINSPETHAAGRLFDSFAACLNISPNKITYEGQGAIRLEAEACKFNDWSEKLLDLPFDIMENSDVDMLYVNWNKMFEFLYDKLKDNSIEKLQSQIPLLAYSFHNTVVNSAVEMIKFALGKFPKEKNVVFSGGVFMNKIITYLLTEKLKKIGLNVFIHQKVPPNDGGIALGQSVICNKIISE